MRKSKLFEMALSAISVASLRFTTAPAQNSQDMQDFGNVKRRLNFEEVKFEIESRPSIESNVQNGKLSGRKIDRQPAKSFIDPGKVPPRKRDIKFTSKEGLNKHTSSKTLSQT